MFTPAFRCVLLRKAWEGLFTLDDMIRLHRVGFVALWPLLGLASTSGWTLRSFIAIVSVAFFFNSFGVVLNDIVDLPVDKTAALRSSSPLVRGAVTPRQALVLTIVQLPLMFASHFLGGFSGSALPLLLGVVLCLTAYDLWSKTSRIPLVMDASLALSGFFFVLYGASVHDQPLTPLVWPVAVSAALFLLYVNAFSNGLRDIENDRSCGRCTTPIWLGCLGVRADRMHVSTSMSVYSGLLQSILIVLALSVGQFVPSDAGNGVSTSTFLAVLLASLVNCILFVLQHRVDKQNWDILMRFHLLILPLPLMLAFISQLGTSRSLVLFTMYFGGPAILAPALLGERGRNQHTLAMDERSALRRLRQKATRTSPTM